MLKDYFPKQWQSYIDLDKLDPVEEFLEEEIKAGRDWQPSPPEIFRALELTTPESQSVNLIGMDPYPTKGVPNGLAFSVNPRQPIPKSLVNIFKEYHDDLGYPIPESGDLTSWAKNGCLLLNSALTCRVGEPDSHMKLWEPFSKNLLEQIAARHTGLVFILLGSKAQSRMIDIDLSNHYVIKAPHPSPLSAYRGFFGSKIFTKTNEFLETNHRRMDWELL